MRAKPLHRKPHGIHEKVFSGAGAKHCRPSKCPRAMPLLSLQCGRFKRPQSGKAKQVIRSDPGLGGPAKELVALEPEVIVAIGTALVTAVRRDYAWGIVTLSAAPDGRVLFFSERESLFARKQDVVGVLFFASARPPFRANQQASKPCKQDSIKRRTACAPLGTTT
jgi:hypothetical protein